ncbi:MAG: AAA family ATPase [Cyclobacteriaceae bacterium]
MKKGKINKPTQRELPANLASMSIQDMIFEIIQVCEVEVDDEGLKILQEQLNDLLKNVEAREVKTQVKWSEEIATIKSQLQAKVDSTNAQISNMANELAEWKANKTISIEVKQEGKESLTLGTQHYLFATLFNILQTGLNVYLVGPSGSGKTYAAQQCATALGVDFYFTGAVSSEFKLTGFINAQGDIVSTEFRKAYENGGLFLFDEIDASYPQAVLAFNAALANDFMDFPDMRVKRHENFFCIAAANTYGSGADRQYVGRNQLDAASLDRFVFLDWDYDEKLERELTANDEWCNIVQQTRRLVVQNKIRHLVSPRASIFGSKLLSRGFNIDTVKNLVLWKGLDQTTIDKLQIELAPTIEIKSEKNGEFRPSVKVGDEIHFDQEIGTINDGNYFDIELVHAKNVGVVQMVRDKSQVQIADTLCVITLFE